MNHYPAGKDETVVALRKRAELSHACPRVSIGFDLRGGAAIRHRVGLAAQRALGRFRDRRGRDLTWSNLRVVPADTGGCRGPPAHSVGQPDRCSSASFPDGWTGRWLAGLDIDDEIPRVVQSV